MARVRRGGQPARTNCPIASLPTELLLYIFELGCEAPIDPDCYRYKWPRAPQPKPLACEVCQVCTKWKRIVKYNASLWVTTLVYNKNTIGPVPHPQLEWVTRRNSGHLDIIVEPEVALPLLFGILDALAPYSKRWRAVLITQNPAGLYHFGRRLNTIGKEFAALRVFSFRASPPCAADMQVIEEIRHLPPVIWDEFDPPVVSLDFYGVTPGWKHCNLLTRLKYLSIVLESTSQKLSASALVSALRTSPDLQTLRIKVAYLRNDLKPETLEEPIVLPRLLHFEFMILRNDMPTQLLMGAFRTPKVRFFRVMQIAGVEAQDIPLPAVEQSVLTLDISDILAYFTRYRVSSSLRRLNLDLLSGVPLQDTPSTNPISLPALESFYIRSGGGVGHTTFSSYSLLSRFDMPNLQDLMMIYPPWKEDDELIPVGRRNWRKPPLVFPRLNRLLVNNIHHSTVHHMFAGISAPSLRRFAISEIPNSDGEDLWTIIRQHYWQLLLPLQEVELRIFSGSRYLPQFYACMPNVTHLAIILKAAHPEWLTCLGEPDDANEDEFGVGGTYWTAPVPKLIKLEICYREIAHHRDWSMYIRKLVMRRNQMRRMLQGLAVDAPIPEDEWEWLMSNVHLYPGRYNQLN